MQVICIDATPKQNKDQFPEGLVEGQSYEASQSPMFDYCYNLAEIPFAKDGKTKAAFNKNRFVPLSNVNEALTVAESIVYYT